MEKGWLNAEEVKTEKNKEREKSARKSANKGKQETEKKMAINYYLEFDHKKNREKAVWLLREGNEWIGFVCGQFLSYGFEGIWYGVLPKYRTVIFVQGCFWHGHDCKYFKVPKTKTEYWLAKLEANKARDHINSEKLVQLGWRVILIWECTTKNNSLDLKNYWINPLISDR